MKILYLILLFHKFSYPSIGVIRLYHYGNNYPYKYDDTTPQKDIELIKSYLVIFFLRLNTSKLQIWPDVASQSIRTRIPYFVSFAGL